MTMLFEIAAMFGKLILVIGGGALLMWGRDRLSRPAERHAPARTEGGRYGD